MNKPYVPSRLAPKEVEAPYKTCRTCGHVKPNTFEFFGKKIKGTRTNFVTTDVCKICRNANISKGMTKTWAERNSGS